MPKPRAALIQPDTTPYYHCVSRCVRRAFLCGEDVATGRSFEHRRGWIESRLLALSEIFAVEVCGYAVMNNHTHVVLYVDLEAARGWSVREVLERWHGLFSGVDLSHRYLRGIPMGEAELQAVEDIAELWRERLSSVSWFMRCLNEHVARLANAEDGCTGRFWEGRFKSQALLDEAALAACLAYVDLNPVRAGLARSPEDSDHTSVQRRIRALENAPASKGEAIAESPSSQPPELFPFVGYPREDLPKGLPFRLADYLALVDWTGRVLRDDKRGVIPDNLPPILERLRIEPEAWMRLTTRFEADFPSLAGRTDSLRQACAALGRRWVRGAGACRQLFAV